jgi:hypothetical protein
MSGTIAPAALLRLAAAALRERIAECGDAVADWLESAAVDAEQIGPDPHAVAAARQILGDGVEPTAPEAGQNGAQDARGGAPAGAETPEPLSEPQRGADDLTFEEIDELTDAIHPGVGREWTYEQRNELVLDVVRDILARRRRCGVPMPRVTFAGQPLAEPDHCQLAPHDGGWHHGASGGQWHDGNPADAPTDWGDVQLTTVRPGDAPLRDRIAAAVWGLRVDPDAARIADAALTVVGPVLDRLTRRADHAEAGQRREETRRDDERYAAREAIQAARERASKAEDALRRMRTLAAELDAEEAYGSARRIRAALDGGEQLPATPPSEVLPANLLAEIRPHMLRGYLSTACDTAIACTRAELPLCAERLHARCRRTHKFTGEPCGCRCHQDGGDRA